MKISGMAGKIYQYHSALDLFRDDQFGGYRRAYPIIDKRKGEAFQYNTEAAKQFVSELTKVKQKDMKRRPFLNKRRSRPTNKFNEV